MIELFDIIEQFEMIELFDIIEQFEIIELFKITKLFDMIELFEARLVTFFLSCIRKICFNILLFFLDTFFFYFKFRLLYGRIKISLVTETFIS